MMVFFGLAHAEAGLSKTKSKHWTYLSHVKNRGNESIVNKFKNDLA